MAVHDWSTTPGSNTGILAGISLDGSVLNVPLIDDSFREMAAQIADQLGKVGFKGADIPSATAVNLALATGWYVDVTGSVGPIASFGTVAAGQMFILRFSGSPTITHNASTLILPQGASVIASSGDVAIMMSLGGGAWRCVSYMSASSTFMPAGTIVDYGGTAAPSGWLLCYGQAISRATYASLFAVISTTYGVGDGSTTFNVPDLRGRVTAGQDDMGGTSANRLTGVTGSVNGDTMGASGGAETHTLTTAQLAAHSHGVTDPQHAHAYTDASPSTVGVFSVSGGTGMDGVVLVGRNTSLGSTGISIQNAGSDAAHNNVQPTTIVNKIIKT